MSFRREAMVPRGGPDGGDGGNGGDVVLQTDPRLHSLLDLRFQKVYRAQDGEAGQGRNRSGRNGANLMIRVPPGTLVRDQNGHIMHDLTGEATELVLLKGGLGGKGNTFYKSSVNQAPTVAQKGLPGQEIQVRLELKLLADVGIIGLPNAGKSTLISRVSAARPKIADYPFTTLVPNLGVVRFAEDLSFVIADIPGLIEGAHAGAGLGTQFLRHVERCRVLAHLIDAGGLAAKDPMAAYEEVRRELEMYDREKTEEEGFRPLSVRPEIVVLNKVDLVEETVVDNWLALFRGRGLPVLAVSAATGLNMKELVAELGRRVFGGL